MNEPFNDKEEIAEKNESGSDIEVNIEEIMKEIRAQIARENISENIPGLEEIPIELSGKLPEDRSLNNLEAGDWNEFINTLQYVNTNYYVPYYWELGPSGPKRFIKRVIRKLNKFLLTPILERLNNINAHFVRCFNYIRYHIEDERRLFQKFSDDMKSLEQKLYEQKAIADKYREELDTMKQLQSELKEAILVQRQEVSGQREQLDNEIANLLRRVDSLDQESDNISSNAAKLLLKYRNGSTEESTVNVKPESGSIVSADAQTEADDTYALLDYFKFQNRFRGTRSVIKERQQMYVPYYLGKTAPILDIGCGRGEFLQLMHDNDIPAFGIDLYPEYVMEGELNGLDIRQGDGLAFLAESTESYGGIFVGQVIEHIPFSKLVELCFNAYNRLEAGGYLIMETPNPESLSIFTSSFYIDPTHIKPVHPLTLEYVLKEAGFKDVRIVYTDDSRPEQLPLIEGDGIKNIDEVNRAVERISNTLFGSLDYAVIAKK